ncbi:hypothetical protein LSCM1_01592 [Leishmania martiniquensis]|uniref:Uncharacterized protein n=1 Tax=Leishmania martiniquensis TaxID=1580590 RepID=A0A836KCP3_9TRYP|nr:hypothetical protein LSCM1_01592 [Leishmania martiniquensis]
MREQAAYDADDRRLPHATGKPEPAAMANAYNGKATAGARANGAAATPYASALETQWSAERPSHERLIDSPVVAEGAAWESQEAWKKRPAKVQAQDAEVQGDAVPAGSSQVRMTIPQAVGGRSHSSEAEPRRSGACVFVRMPEEVRRRRARSRESLLNGARSKSGESGAPFTSDSAATQPAAENAGNYNPATKASPAAARGAMTDTATEAGNPEHVDGSSTEHEEAQENHWNASATGAHGEATPNAGASVLAASKNDKEKSRCCTVM